MAKFIKSLYSPSPIYIFKAIFQGEFRIQFLFVLIYIQKNSYLGTHSADFVKLFFFTERVRAVFIIQSGCSIKFKCGGMYQITVLLAGREKLISLFTISIAEKLVFADNHVTNDLGGV